MKKRFLSSLCQRCRLGAGIPINFLRVCGLAVVFLAAGSLVESKAQSVSGSIGSGTINKGVAARGTIVLSIPGGLHVNSNRPAGEYAIPTSVRLSAKGARVGSVTYPRGRNRKFSFSESTLNVYEGRVTFGFNVTVPADYKGSTVAVNASVRYQACTDEVCYPPKTKQVTLTAKVR